MMKKILSKIPYSVLFIIGAFFLMASFIGLQLKVSELTIQLEKANSQLDVCQHERGAWEKFARNRISKL
jgi:hypothetical protein